MRWLTVNLPGDPERQMLLETARAARARMRPPPSRSASSDQGSLGLAPSSTTDDVCKTLRDAKRQGRRDHRRADRAPYGIDCGIRDPFGNNIRIVQPATGPIEIPDPSEFASG